MAGPLQKLIVGNWKMNGQPQAASTLVTAIGNHIRQQPSPCAAVICPPFTLLAGLFNLCKGYGLGLGAQDCSEEIAGAFTGDISARMVKEAGCGYVILGHSERRHYHQETNATVRAKAESALAEGLVAIICIGETEMQYNQGKTLETVGKQLETCLPPAAGLVVAYEPVWAIGTGKTPTLDEIKDVHQFIYETMRKAFEKPVKILYGGSVKSQNAGEILAIPHVDGLLVGGASLDAREFTAIMDAAVLNNISL